MYATDFEFDGQFLSDYGFIICNFDYSDGKEIATAGSRISFDKVSMNHGKQFSLVNTKYEDCLTTTFDICKDPDIFDYEDRKILNEEFRTMMRWLNRREFLQFRILYSDNDYREDCYYNVSFNIDKIMINDTLYGLRLTLESDSPFGYGNTITKQLIFDESPTDPAEIIPSSIPLYDESDEIGYIYPDMIIECKDDGLLIITNQTIGSHMMISDCRKGETITVNGNENIIQTNKIEHDICNHFNWEFLKIGNTIKDRINMISASKKCKITISYRPIIKDVP